MKILEFFSPAVLTDSVPKTLTALSIPMIVGIAANMSYLLADAYFIGLLGEKELAIVGYSQPIQMLILQLSIGMSIGASSVISRIVGENDESDTIKASKSVVLLCVFIAILIVVIGIMLTYPIFALIGAKEDIMPLVKEYMIINFPALGFQFFVTSTSSLFRARGNMLVPGCIICVSAFINTVLDPILIFGHMGLPAMGLQGAAYSSLVAYFLAACLSMFLLVYKYQWLNFKSLSLNDLTIFFKKVSTIAIPAALSNSANPVATSFATYLLSSYGNEVVGAFGMATRIRAFALIPLLALSAGVSPFSGQNYGAKKIVRLKEAWRWGIGSSLFWGVFLILLFTISNHQIARLFLQGENQIEITAQYLFIVCFGFGFCGISINASSMLNAFGKPIVSSLLIFFRMIVLYPIFTFVGQYFLGVKGIFCGIALAQILGGLIALIYLTYFLHGGDGENTD